MHAGAGWEGVPPGLPAGQKLAKRGRQLPQLRRNGAGTTAFPRAGPRQGPGEIRTEQSRQEVVAAQWTITQTSHTATVLQLLL